MSSAPIRYEPNDPRYVPVVIDEYGVAADDDYADFDEEAARIEKLFADPKFTRAELDRQLVQPEKAIGAGGSLGRAMALGFANIFDPDRVKDDIVVIQERGEGDSDVPETIIDPEDPTVTKVIYKDAPYQELAAGNGNRDS
jgi:hypothetical protein